jgi:hypothetical protein
MPANWSCILFDRFLTQTGTTKLTLPEAKSFFTAEDVNESSSLDERLQKQADPAIREPLKHGTMKDGCGQACRSLACAADACGPVTDEKKTLIPQFALCNLNSLSFCTVLHFRLLVMLAIENLQ